MRGQTLDAKTYMLLTLVCLSGNIGTGNIGTGNIEAADPPVANEAKESPEFLSGVVTDREGKPIQGASVVSIRWGGKEFAQQEVVQSNAKGEFQYPFTDIDMQLESRYVAIHKAGYAVNALNLAAQPAQVRLWPMKPVAMRIVDNLGEPVAGASVVANVISFDDEFLQSELPRELAKLNAVVSRPDGWAILRCTRPPDLQSVHVSKEGFGTQAFATSFQETRFNVFRLCETHKAVINLTRNGKPVDGWLVKGAVGDGWVNSELDENRDPKNDQLLPVGIAFNAKTTEAGSVTIDHALIDRDMFASVIDAKRRYRGTHGFRCLPDGPSPTLDFQSRSDEVGKSYSVVVQDADTAERIANAKIRFWQNQDVIGDQPETVSDKNGVAEVKLIPGYWSVYCKKAPDGYCAAIASEERFLAKEDVGELPAIKLWKGKTIRGKIVDADLTVPRTRWLHVDWEIAKAKDEVTEGKSYGSYDGSGAFQVVVPTAATPTAYRIVQHGEHQGTLEIRSSEPLELVLDD